MRSTSSPPLGTAPNGEEEEEDERGVDAACLARRALACRSSERASSLRFASGTLSGEDGDDDDADADAASSRSRAAAAAATSAERRRSEEGMAFSSFFSTKEMIQKSQIVLFSFSLSPFKPIPSLLFLSPEGNEDSLPQTLSGVGACELLSSIEQESEREAEGSSRCRRRGSIEQRRSILSNDDAHADGDLDLNNNLLLFLPRLSPPRPPLRQRRRRRSHHGFRLPAAL